MFAHCMVMSFIRHENTDDKQSSMLTDKRELLLKPS